MAEKKITPKAPEKAESGSSKVAAARVSKSVRKRRTVIAKSARKTR